MRWQEIVRKAYALCVANCDNVYTPEDPVAGCKYTRGKCSNGSVGCIFGQILPHDEFDLERYDDEAVKLPGIETVLRDKLPEMPIAAIRWCSQLQGSQDIERSWGDALAIAEDNYGKAVDELLRENP